MQNTQAFPLLPLQTTIIIINVLLHVHILTAELVPNYLTKHLSQVIDTRLIVSTQPNVILRDCA